MSDSFILALEENLKYIIIGYDIVLDRYQYLLYNIKCDNTNMLILGGS